MLIIVNRHQADMSGGGSVAIVAGISAILVGSVFLFAACLYCSFWARRSAGPSIRRQSAPSTFANPEMIAALP